MASLRKQFLRVILSVACVSALALLSVPTPAGALSVSGRAYVLYINVPSAGIIDQSYVDTGYISSAGGSETESAASLDIEGLVSTGTVNSGSHGDDCEGHSSYEVNNVVIMPGSPGEIAFSHGRGHDDDECCDSPRGERAAILEDLTFGGMPIDVTGEFDQTVTIMGVGTLTLNHRHGGGHGGGHGGHGGHGDGDDDEDDCGDDHHVSVFALYLLLEDGGEVTLGSAYFRSHDHCCAVKTEQSTWGAIKGLYQSR